MGIYRNENTGKTNLDKVFYILNDSDSTSALKKCIAIDNNRGIANLLINNVEGIDYSSAYKLASTCSSYEEALQKYNEIKKAFEMQNNVNTLNSNTQSNVNSKVFIKTLNNSPFKSQEEYLDMEQGFENYAS